MPDVKQPIDNLHQKIEPLFFNNWVVEEVTGCITQMF